MNFTALDFETAQGARWSICQIGLVRVENNEIVKTYSKLIKPPMNEYSRNNTMIHGINSKITENSPTFPEIWSEIKGYIENQLLVAHNAEFDLDCLIQTLSLYNLPIPKFDEDCTYKLTDLKLSELCDGLDIKIDNQHDAVKDAIACAKAYIKLMNNQKVDYSKINYVIKEHFDFSGHESLRGDLLKPDLENADKGHVFFGKKVVFTGVLDEFSREDAAQIVKKLGADINTSISKKTNFVIVGSDAGPSKLRKIDMYNAEGCNIKILNENEFKKEIKNGL